MAAGYMESSPWIAYIAAIKCEPFLRHFGIETHSFSEIAEKQMIDELQLYAEELEVESIQRMDSQTKKEIDELIGELSIYSKLKQAVKVVSDIENFEFKDLVLCKLGGKSFAIPVSDFKKETFLRKVAFRAMLISSLLLLYFAFRLNNEIASAFQLFQIVISLVGLLFGIGVFQEAGKREKKALQERERVRRRIADAINNLCGKFMDNVYGFLPLIVGWDGLDNLDLNNMSKGFINLIEGIDRKVERYIQI